MEIQSVYHLPNGPKNLSSLFPDVDFNLVADYYLQVYDADNSVIATTTLAVPETDCEYIRIHFINRLGAVDAINFSLYSQTHETKSDTWQKTLSTPLIKKDGGIQRININSNESYQAIAIGYRESDMVWLKELLDTPAAWLEWTGTQGQPDDYLPVIIKDGKQDTRKMDERYFNEFSIEFTMANATQTIRT
ncbi:hypothetical protein ACE38W_00495 [Chitinophaga sp. Hz27]|uniref:hypothetical protein n=1 Tax=Chitinophaga sp. Hz27 TaxID=3347169 RepID=UPI0035DAB629